MTEMTTVQTQVLSISSMRSLSRKLESILFWTTPHHFDIFRQRAAAEMGVPLQRLSALGYIVSTWPRSPKPVPKLVDTDVRYENMIEGLEEYMKVELTTKGQPKKKKPFSVELIDTGDDAEKKDGKKVSIV